jgi:hypothetical protein
MVNLKKSEDESSDVSVMNDGSYSGNDSANSKNKEPKVSQLVRLNFNKKNESAEV